MLQLYFATILLAPLYLGARNEWEHRYKPMRPYIPLQPLAKVIQMKLVRLGQS